jgi:hypothetical protein
MGSEGEAVRVDAGRAEAIRSAIIARCAVRGVTHASIGRIVGLSRSGVGVRLAKTSPDELKRLAAADLGDVLRPAV